MTKMTEFRLTCLVLTLILSNSVTATTPANYAKAVRDAQVAGQNEIAYNLDAVVTSNDSLIWNNDKTLIKVVTWKSRDAYEQFLQPYTQTSDSEAYVIWVTLAPRMQEFCRNYMRTHRNATEKMLASRLKKRLGLNPDWQYDVFVEMWVNPEDLFRPCVDPSPVDSSCDLNFANTIPQVKNIPDYRSFYQNLYYDDFRAAPGVPWTGLGYTYDWGAKNEQGPSEFILSPKTPYVIEQAIPTMDYCAR